MSKVTNILPYYNDIMSMFEFFFESWMGEEDKKEFIDLFLQKTGVTFKKLNDDIQIGVDNGYSVECQIDLCKQVWGIK